MKASVRRMMAKFGQSYTGRPRKLSKEVYVFRITAMMEELLEYIESVFELGNFKEESEAELIVMRKQLMNSKLKDSSNLDEQFDALLDLKIFLDGAMYLHGFPAEDGYDEVMKANMKKQVVKSADDSKRGFKLDLKKPEGWKPPNLRNLVYPRGLIILDGPDGTGKTTLAEKLRSDYGAEIFHHTWNEDIEKRMGQYLRNSLDSAEKMLRKGQLVVIDRLYMSQRVYSSVFRSDRPDKWESDMALIEIRVERLIADYGGAEVLCLPQERDVYLKHFNRLKGEREEMYVDMARVYDVYYESYGPVSSIQYDMFDSESDYFHKVLVDHTCKWGK